MFDCKTVTLVTTTVTAPWEKYVCPSSYTTGALVWKAAGTVTVIVSPNGGGGGGGLGKAVGEAGQPGYLNGLSPPYGVYHKAAVVVTATGLSR